MGDTFDATFEPVAKHHHWDGDREADGGRQQRLPDAGREDGGADLAAGLGELAEGLDHAEHGAEQAEQRRDAADHLEGAELSAQSLERLVAAAHHFLAHHRLRQIPRSEEHTSELQSLMRISYAVFCLKKQNTPQQHNNYNPTFTPTTQ